MKISNIIFHPITDIKNEIDCIYKKCIIYFPPSFLFSYFHNNKEFSNLWQNVFVVILNLNICLNIFDTYDITSMFI